ncbi:MAG: hypothetical protein ACRC8A_14375 [Microcoleaceae cyanobacterium]
MIFLQSAFSGSYSAQPQSYSAKQSVSSIEKNGHLSFKKHLYLLAVIGITSIGVLAMLPMVYLELLCELIVGEGESNQDDINLS